MKKVSELVGAKELDPTEYITELFTRLEVGTGVSMPTYADLYPEHWAMDKEVEDRHMEISRRIRVDTQLRNYKQVLNIFYIKLTFRQFQILWDHCL